MCYEVGPMEITQLPAMLPWSKTSLCRCKCESFSSILQMLLKVNIGIVFQIYNNYVVTGVYFLFSLHRRFTNNAWKKVCIKWPPHKNCHYWIQSPQRSLIPPQLTAPLPPRELLETRRSKSARSRGVTFQRTSYRIFGWSCIGQHSSWRGEILWNSYCNFSHTGALNAHSIWQSLPEMLGPNFMKPVSKHISLPSTEHYCLTVTGYQPKLH